MLNLTEFEIATTYEVQASMMRLAFEAGEKAIATKSALESARLAATLDGRIDGKNEALREAAARGLLAQQYHDAEVAEAVARLARHDLELARLAVEELRLRLRLAELSAQGQAA